MVQFQNIGKERKVLYSLISGVFIAVSLTLIQDYLRSNINSTSFYFSEAFMFSSFWWVFAPLIYIQFFILKKRTQLNLINHLLLITVPAILHVITFPFLVWLMSALFYYHTYEIQQVLNYTVAEHIYQLIAIYSIPVIINFSINYTGKAAGFEVPPVTINKYIEAIIINSGNKKEYVAVSEISHFTASSPYIVVHRNSKKHLHSETLRSIMAKLDPQVFIRIHKSTVINILMVDSYNSRLNGDYDLVMKDGTILRLSRNYAIAFKDLYRQAHRVA